MSETPQVETPGTPAPEAGLFPTLSKPAPAPAPTETTPSNDWFVMDGVKGTGERPSYLSPKYKTLADQAKAYPELEKKLGANKIVPDKYDLEKYKETINAEDTHIQKLLHVAREKQLDQGALEGVLDVYSEYLNNNKPDYSKEIEKLGPKGREKISTVAQWAQNTLSAESVEIINKIGHSADVINLLDELRQYQVHSQSQVPGQQPVTPFTRITVAEVETEMKQNMARYSVDAKYRAEIKAKFAQALGED